MVKEREADYERQRAGLKEFVERWRRAGPALEEQRYRELQELDDETAHRMTLDLFKLWRPRTVDDMSSGLVEAQKVFFKLACREAQERAGDPRKPPPLKGLRGIWLAQKPTASDRAPFPLPSEPALR